MATTVQTVIDKVQRDHQFGIGADHPAMVDYTNRIHHQILRHTRWVFMLSEPRQFLTQKGVTAYWIGATAGNGAGEFDTLLNITDMGAIKSGSVFDRSNRRVLKKTDEPPMDNIIQTRSGAPNLDRPRMYRQSFNSPDLLQIFPAADNQNNFDLMPLPPILETVLSGSLIARTYNVKVTFLDESGGETAASTGKEFFIKDSLVLKVKSPLLPISGTSALTLSNGKQVTQWRIYADEVAGSETLQATIGIGSDWLEPDTGLILGDQAPSSSSMDDLDGYVIEFRYWKARSELTLVTSALQLPDKYADVVVAGVNWLTSKYIDQNLNNALFWQQEYKDGVKGMIRDSQVHEGEDNFIYPDATSVHRSVIGDDPVALLFFGINT